MIAIINYMPLGVLLYWKLKKIQMVKIDKYYSYHLYFYSPDTEISFITTLGLPKYPVEFGK